MFENLMNQHFPQIIKGIKKPQIQEVQRTVNKTNVKKKKKKERKKETSKFTVYYNRGNSEKAMASHSSTLGWQIPWMEEPGRLQSIGSLRFGHD